MSTALPPQRPPSRSERLLRETLRRDGEVRDTGMTSPPKPALSRRHSSRVSSPPQPIHSASNESYFPPSRPSSPCRYAADDEQCMRGNYLFRSAITNSPLPQGMFPPALSPQNANASVVANSSDGTLTPAQYARMLNGNGPHSPSYRSRTPSRSMSPSSSSTRRHSLQRSHHHHEAHTLQEHALRAKLEGFLEADQASSYQCRRCSQVGGAACCCDQTRSGSVMTQPQFIPPPSTSPQSLIPRTSPSVGAREQPTRTHTRSRSQTDPTNRHFAHSTASRARTTTTTTYTANPTPTSTAATSHTSPLASASSMSPRRAAVNNNNPTNNMTHHHPQLPPTRSSINKKHNSIERTPPLTADASPTGIGERSELEPDDSRLITPPPSPPPHHSSSNGSRKSHHHHQHQQPHSPSPYRPIGDWYPSFASEDVVSHPHPGPRALRTPHSPSSRSQFNVRKASEQCKLIDGYVSFLSIEGLGGPPDADSPVVGDDEVDENERRNREKRMFGIGWNGLNGLKKLLPLSVVSGTHTSPQEAAGAR